MNSSIFISLVTIIEFFILWIVNFLNECKKIDKKVTFVFNIVFVTLMLTFRDYSQGLNDTIGTYMPIFNNIANDATRTPEYINMISDQTSYTFYLYNLFCSKIGGFRFFLFVSAFIFVFGIELFLYKNLNSIGFANFIFSIFILPYGYFLVRQGISMGLFSIFLVFLLKRKYILAIVFAVLAFSFHSISILPIFLATLCILCLRFSRKTILILFTSCTLFLLVFKIPLFELFINFLPEGSKYKDLLQLGIYQTGGMWIIPSVIFSMMFLISVFYLWPKKENKNIKYFILLSMLSAILMILTEYIEEFSRFSIYLFVGNLILAYLFYRKLDFNRKTVCVVVLVIYAFGFSFRSNNIINFGI